MKKNSKNYIDEEYIAVILQTLLNMARNFIQINNFKTIQIFQLHFKRTLTQCAAEYFVCVCACVCLLVRVCAWWCQCQSTAWHSDSSPGVARGESQRRLQPVYSGDLERALRAYYARQAR